MFIRICLPYITISNVLINLPELYKLRVKGGKRYDRFKNIVSRKCLNVGGYIELTQKQMKKKCEQAKNRKPEKEKRERAKKRKCEEEKCERAKNRKRKTNL